MKNVHQFLVYFRDPLSEERRQGIAEDGLVQDVYALSDHDMLVRSEIADPRALAALMGFKGDDKHAGVILKLNGSYSGYYSPSLWDWLDEARDDTA